MRLKILVVSFLLVVSILCFIVVYIMHSNLSFIDYPYLYAKDDNTKIYLGEKNHWRLVSESLVTFMTSKELIVKHFKELEKMGVEWVDPWEKPLHNLYKDYPCLSPIPSLAVHCANINSVFGVSPLCNIKNLWDENEN